MRSRKETKGLVEDADYMAKVVGATMFIVPAEVSLGMFCQSLWYVATSQNWADSHD